MSDMKSDGSCSVGKIVYGPNPTFVGAPQTGAVRDPAGHMYSHLGTPKLLDHPKRYDGIKLLDLIERVCAETFRSDEKWMVKEQNVPSTRGHTFSDGSTLTTTNQDILLKFYTVRHPSREICIALRQTSSFSCDPSPMSRMAVASVTLRLESKPDVIITEDELEAETRSKIHACLVCFINKMSADLKVAHIKKYDSVIDAFEV